MDNRGIAPTEDPSTAVELAGPQRSNSRQYAPDITDHQVCAKSHISTTCPGSIGT
jgi:hypothetical protein